MGIKGEVAAASLDVNVTAPPGPVMFDPPQTKVWGRYQRRRQLPVVGRLGATAHPTRQRLADECYERLRENPRHLSLHSKTVGRFWSVRVGLRHRAIGVEDEDCVVWFWSAPTPSMTASSIGTDRS